MTNSEIAKLLADTHAELVTQWQVEGPGAVWDTLEQADRSSLMGLLMAHVGASAATV